MLWTKDSAGSFIIEQTSEPKIRSIGSGLKKCGSAKFSGSISGNEINLDEGSGVYEERLAKTNAVHIIQVFNYENINQY